MAVAEGHASTTTTVEMEGDDEVSDDETERKSSRPESPRTTAARYLLDLANVGDSEFQQDSQLSLQAESDNENHWRSHDNRHTYILEECGLPFSSDQMLLSCQTLSDLTKFLTRHSLTEEQTALCYAVYQMQNGGSSHESCSSNSPNSSFDIPSLHHLSQWNLIHLLDHSYASSTSMMNSRFHLSAASCGAVNNAMSGCGGGSTNEEASSNSDGGTSSTGSMTECDLSSSR